MKPSGTGGSKALRNRVDLLFGSIFLLAAVRWLAVGLFHGEEFWPLLTDSRFWLVGVMGAYFFLGLKLTFLRHGEPFLFLATAAIPFFQTPESIFGFSLFAVGAIMLYVDGRMRTHPLAKILLLGSYLVLLVGASTLVNRATWEEAAGLLLFMTGFFLYLFLTFQDKIIVFVKGQKPKVSLRDRGLTETEAVYLMALLQGKAIKEIAWEHGVKDSTVRNALSRGYHRLGFADKTQLLQWAENHAVEP